jgi:hypothetical protein
MKKSTWFLLVVSLAVNTALLAAFALRRPESEAQSPAPMSASETKDAPAAIASTPVSSSGAAATAKAAGVPAVPPKELWELLASRDPATFAANLRAAGFQVGMVRGAVYALLRDLQTPERTKAVDSITSTTYWKNDVPPEASAAYGKEISRLWQERDRIMRSIFPEEQEAFALKMQARFGPISEATMLKISAIEQDYSEMQSQTRARSSGSGILQMPWSGEELALLDREKLKDIAALLSPAELENYQMRGSTVGQTLQRQLDGFDPSEREYREIYRLRAIADTASRANGPLGGMTPEGIKAREELETGLKTALGDTRYAEYQRGQDRSFQAALEVTRTFGLPASKATEVYDVQQQMRMRQSEIRAATASNPADRQAQLTVLTAETNQKLAAILTPAGLEQLNKGQRGGMIFIGN